MDANLSLIIWANVSVADPGDLVLLFGRATNSGNETATNITLEVPLDANSTYSASFPNATYDPVNRTLRWTTASLAVGANKDVYWTIRINVGTPDNTTILNRLRATYHNATGVLLPPKEIALTVRVRAPVFAPQLRPLPTGAGRGDTVVAKLYVNNTGSATALRGWSNWTLGGHFRFLLLEEPFSVTNETDGFNVTMSNLAPGPHAVTAHLEVLRSLDDGLPMGIQTQWTATDGNGNRLSPSGTGSSVVLFAPKFTLDLNTSASPVNTSSRFVLTATLRNTGRAVGIGWLNMTLPGEVSFVADNGTFRRTNQGKRYTWTIPSVSPGSAVVLGITFESGAKAEAATFAFALAYTDDRGTPPVSGPAPRIDIEFVTPATGSPADGGFPWWLVAVAAAGVAAMAFWWRRRQMSEIQVEDVFVADMGGHLLAHRSSGLVAYEDEDILIGMFKVIQDFVKDSFAKGTDDVMRSMEFGERKIIIERGRFHFISVVYRGLDRGSLAERVRKVSRLIDHRYGQALENWSGDLDELRGLAALLPQVWKHQPRSRAPLQPGSVPPPGTRSPSEGKASGAEKGGGSAESSDPEAVVGPQK